MDEELVIIIFIKYRRLKSTNQYLFLVNKGTYLFLMEIEHLVQLLATCSHFGDQKEVIRLKLAILTIIFINFLFAYKSFE